MATSKSLLYLTIRAQLRGGTLARRSLKGKSAHCLGENVDERYADEPFLLVVLGSVAPRDTALGSEGPTARLLRWGRCPDPAEQQRRQRPTHHRPVDERGCRRHRGLSQAAQSLRPPGGALLLLHERGREYARRL